MCSKSDDPSTYSDDTHHSCGNLGIVNDADCPSEHNEHGDVWCSRCGERLLIPAEKELVCGRCYLLARPDQYEPETYVLGECAVCGDYTFTHRVSQAEIDDLRSRNA